MSYKEPLILVSAFSCALTNEERNAWSRYLRENHREVYLVFATLEVKLQSLTTHFGDDEARSKTVRNHAEARDAMFDIAEAWYKTLCASREERSDG